MSRSHLLLGTSPAAVRQIAKFTISPKRIRKPRSKLLPNLGGNLSSVLLSMLLLPRSRSSSIRHSPWRSPSWDGLDSSQDRANAASAIGDSFGTAQQAWDPVQIVSRTRIGRSRCRARSAGAPPSSRHGRRPRPRDRRDARAACSGSRPPARA